MHASIWARLVLVVVVLVMACLLAANGRDLATTLLPATALLGLLGMAADTARRILPAQPARREAT